MAKPFFLEDKCLQLLLFGGKGGVGKTTCATATALRFAENTPHGSFLLVSTDPAHSLSDSLSRFLPPANLKIIELDAQQHFAAFKLKHGDELREIASRGTFLDDEDINDFLNLSLPGLDELMAFVEISRWVEDQTYDCIVVDTAPTASTTRLLTMPELMQKWLEALDALLGKHRYMKRLFSGSYHRDQVDEFIMDLSASVKQTEALLKDPARCRFVPVMLAEELIIRETVALVDKLERLKVPVTDIVVNKVYPESACPVCANGLTRQMKELNHFPLKLSGYYLWAVPLYPEEVRGLFPLKAFWEDASTLYVLPSEAEESEPALLCLPTRVEAGADSPPHEKRLLLFAGKGGVGKSTLACATALRLAQEFGHKEVFLFSTDPAHSLSGCLDVEIGPKPKRVASGLTAMEIDSEQEFETLKNEYAEELERFLGTISPNLDLTFDREVMERIMDLSPPGLDELMALTRAMEFLTQGSYDFFILDSAPTGHLIRLLELPELIDGWLKVFFRLFLKYKHIFRLPKISRRLVQMSKDIKLLRRVLKDPTRSSLYAVTHLTEMAYEETKDLIGTCERMKIHVPVIFLNMATPASECPLCSALYKREWHVRAKFQRTFPGLHQALVYRQDEPLGLKRLGQLGEALYKTPEKRGIEEFGIEELKDERTIDLGMPNERPQNP